MAQLIGFLVAMYLSSLESESKGRITGSGH